MGSNEPVKAKIPSVAICSGFGHIQHSFTGLWVLRAEKLHLCFAVLHGLGKYLEGSGLDTIAAETGIKNVTFKSMVTNSQFFCNVLVPTIWIIHTKITKRLHFTD